MTPLQVSTLQHAAKAAGLPRSVAAAAVFPGASLVMLYQMGRSRQVKWLMDRRLARIIHGRLVATKAGRRVLSHQLGE